MHLHNAWESHEQTFTRYKNRCKEFCSAVINTLGGFFEGKKI